jgi:hypothetical protein
LLIFVEDYKFFENIIKGFGKTKRAGCTAHGDP